MPFVDGRWVEPKRKRVKPKRVGRGRVRGQRVNPRDPRPVNMRGAGWGSPEMQGLITRDANREFPVRDALKTTFGFMLAPLIDANHRSSAATDAIISLAMGDTGRAKEAAKDVYLMSPGGAVVEATKGRPRQLTMRPAVGSVTNTYITPWSPIRQKLLPDGSIAKDIFMSGGSYLAGDTIGDFIHDTSATIALDPINVIPGLSGAKSVAKLAAADLVKKSSRGVRRNIVDARRADAMRNIRRGPNERTTATRNPASIGADDFVPQGQAGGFVNTGPTNLDLWQLRMGGRNALTPTGKVATNTPSKAKAPVGFSSDVERAAAHGLPDTQTGAVLLNNELNAVQRAIYADALNAFKRSPTMSNRSARSFLGLGGTLGDMPNAAWFRQQMREGNIPWLPGRTGATIDNAMSAAGESPIFLPNARKWLRNEFTRYGELSKTGAGVWELANAGRAARDRADDASDKSYQVRGVDFSKRVRGNADSISELSAREGAPAVKYGVEDAADAVTLEAITPQWADVLLRENPEQFSAMSRQALEDVAYENLRTLLRNNFGRDVPSRQAVRTHLAEDVNYMRKSLAELDAAEMAAGLRRGQREFYVPQMRAFRNRRNRRSVRFYDQSAQAQGLSRSETFRPRERKDIGGTAANNPNQTAASMHSRVIESLGLYLRTPDQPGGIGILPELNFLNLLRMRQRDHAGLMAKNTINSALAQRYGKTLDVANSRAAIAAEERIARAKAALDAAESEWQAMRGRRRTKEDVAQAQAAVRDARENYEGVLRETRANRGVTDAEADAMVALDEALARPIRNADEVRAAEAALEIAQNANKPRELDNLDFPLERLLDMRKRAVRKGWSTEDLDRRIAAKVIDPVTQMSRFLGRGPAAREVRRLERELKKSYDELLIAENRLFNTRAKDPVHVADEIYGLLARIVDADETLQRALTYREVALQRTFAGGKVSGKKGRTRKNPKTGATTTSSTVGRGGLKKQETQFVERSRERLELLYADLNKMLDVDSSSELARYEVIEGKLAEAQAHLDDIDKYLARREAQVEKQVAAARKKVQAAKVKAKKQKAAEVAAARRGVRDEKKKARANATSDELRQAERELDVALQERSEVLAGRRKIKGTPSGFRKIGRVIAEEKRRAKKADTARKKVAEAEARLLNIPGERISQADFDANMADGWRRLGDKLHYEFTIVPGATNNQIERALGQVFGMVGDQGGIYNLINTTNTLRGMTSTWKRLALATTGYSIRNAIGDSIAMVMGGFTNPESLAVAYKIFKRNAKTGEYKHTGRIGSGYGDLTYEQLREEVFTQQIRQSGFAGSDVQQALNKITKRHADLHILPKKINGGVLRVHGPSIPGRGEWATRLYKMNESRENFVRTAMYVEKRRQGLDPLVAQSETMKWLFDYGDVAPMISALRRFWIPFIVWPSKMYPRVIEAYLTNTKIFAWYKDIAMSSQQAAEKMYGAQIELDEWGVPTETSTMFAVPLPGFLEPLIGGAAGAIGAANPPVYSGRSSLPFAVLDDWSPSYAPIADDLPLPLRVPVSTFASIGASANPFAQFVAQRLGYDPRARDTRNPKGVRAAGPLTSRIADLTIGTLGGDDEKGGKNLFGARFDPSYENQSGDSYSAISKTLSDFIGLYPPQRQIEGLVGFSGLSDKIGSGEIDMARWQQAGSRQFTGLDIKPIDIAKARARFLKYGP